MHIPNMLSSHPFPSHILCVSELSHICNLPEQMHRPRLASWLQPQQRQSRGVAAVAMAAAASTARSVRKAHPMERRRVKAPSRRDYLAGSASALLAQSNPLAAAAEVETKEVQGAFSWDPAEPESESMSLARRLAKSAKLINPRRRTSAADSANADEMVPAKPSVYPAWLFGEWQNAVAPLRYEEPLGERFIDEDTRASVREDFRAQKPSGERKRSDFGWQSRFYTPPPTEDVGGLSGVDLQTMMLGDRPVVQYRAFNAAQEVKAFMGSKAPAVLTQSDASQLPPVVVIRYEVLNDSEDAVGSQESLLQTIRITLENSQVQASGDNAISSELLRQVVYTNGEVESIGEFEVITAYKFLSENHVRARCRIAKYLVPGDTLYEEARSTAVSLVDYDWDMQRISTCISTPVGSQCIRAV
eukprot:TRINITY_DN55703_c0_g1_i1.p1 TRINITY_DN55703_c0_g1~~TRINITY_DN55703_c0_g1_i1.p1  ORF type:complete len:416 (+),score=83.42 TRINITY_DN55703_c0_g1_i1:29-1276(+)